jgi:hypothetical protein
MRSGFVVLAVAIAVLATACGGGGKLSKQELVAKANAICRDSDAKFKALGTPRTMEDLKNFADKAMPIAKDGRKKLGDLEPPDELAATYRQWLAEGDKAVDAIARVRAAAAADRVTEVQKIGREARAEDAKSDRLATRLGFTDCVQG